MPLRDSFRPVITLSIVLGSLLQLARVSLHDQATDNSDELCLLSFVISQPVLLSTEHEF